MATEVLWWIFAAAIVGVAAGVVLSRSVIHSAIFLIGALAGVGAMYLFLKSEFLAITQFLIYGGAVTVLILLALMLTRMGAAGRPEPVNGPQTPWAVVAALGILAILLGTVLATDWPGDVDDEATAVSITTVSNELFQTFGFPFIVASVLLLVALIGAVILARQEDD